MPLSRSNLKRYFQASICKTRSTWNLEEEDHKYFMEPHLAIITHSRSLCTIQFLYFCQRKDMKILDYFVQSIFFPGFFWLSMKWSETLVIWCCQKNMILIDYHSTWAHQKKTAPKKHVPSLYNFLIRLKRFQSLSFLRLSSWCTSVHNSVDIVCAGFYNHCSARAAHSSFKISALWISWFFLHRVWVDPCHRIPYRDHNFNF